MNECGKSVSLRLRDEWWHVRFFAWAAIHLDFEHPRVQRLVQEHLEKFA